MRGRRARRHETLRSCIGCRRRAVPGELVRLAADGDRIVVSRTAPGRGAWLCPGRPCFERARRSRAFQRALRHQGELDVAEVEELFGPGTAFIEVCEDRERGRQGASRRG